MSLTANQPKKVSLTTQIRSEAPHLLKQEGADTILGIQNDIINTSVRPEKTTLFGPRGVCVLPDRKGLWVCDTGHHRILGWKNFPLIDNAPADLVIGQKDFYSEGRNGKRKPEGNTVNVPTGITLFRNGLAVADAWNHRVLIWNEIPLENNQPADFVLGQHSFSEINQNQGKDIPTASSLNWPYGVFAHNNILFVADSKNRRVLMWENSIEENAQPADVVLGQSSFEDDGDNAGKSANSMSMRWPHGVWAGDKLFISDAGNNRVMVWNHIPKENAAPADFVLGQKSFSGVDHNSTLYYPNESTLNMPYGLVCNQNYLIVADTANSRLLGWKTSKLHEFTQNNKHDTTCPAGFISGQVDFNHKGDNRWESPARDTFCWPYGLHMEDDVVAIADSGNNRVMLWRLLNEE